MSLYDTDFYAWAIEQARLLRERRFDEADWTNIIEEIESLGRNEKRILREHLAVLMGRLLRWQLQPIGRCHPWQSKIREERCKLDDHLGESPSLRPMLADEVARTWHSAVYWAQMRAKLEDSAFPAECPWKVEQVLDPEFYPE
jgi:hypothetical protein